MVHIRRSQAADFDEVIALLQRVFESTYASDKRDIPAELFSLQNFMLAPMQEHFKEMLSNTGNNASWVAESTGRIVGTISATYYPEHDEIRGFYVDMKHQGKGIGTQLWNEMLRERRSRKLIVDVFTGTDKTIQMYKQWGFRQPLLHRYHPIQWDGWPPEYVLRTVRLQKRYAA